MKKALVVYFSATGNTKAVAETLSEIQGADLYEIVPEEPYSQSRMTRMHDRLFLAELIIFRIMM